MANRKLIVELVGDSRSLDRAFGRAGKAATGFQSHMKKVAYGAGAVIGGAFLTMGLALRRGFRELMESQKVAAQTNAVLKSTGAIAGVTAKHVDAMSGALSRMTGVDDEVIGAGENMLLTFTNIRNSVGKGPKVFDQATKAVLDMSVAMGRDMTTTAIMVGKALNDVNVNAKGTITGWSALRRVGVNISPVLMKQAAAFIKAGKPMRAQLLLLKELRTEFGGSAKAFGSTLPGAFGKLHNAIDELTGAFAKGLAPVVQRVATLISNKMADPKFVAQVQHLGHVVGTTLLNAFIRISAWFSANWPQILAALRVMLRIVRNIGRAIQITAQNLQSFADFAGHFGFLKTAGEGVIGGIRGFEHKVNALTGTGKEGNNKGITVHGDVHVHGVQNPGQLYEKIHHTAKKKSKQTRGRHQPGLYHH